MESESLPPSSSPATQGEFPSVTMPQSSHLKNGHQWGCNLTGHGAPKSGFCCAQPGTARAPSCAPGFPPLGAAPPQPPRSPEVGGGRTLQADSAQWTLTQHSGLAVHLSRAPGDPPITPSPPAWRGRCTLPDSLPPLGSLRFWPGMRKRMCHFGARIGSFSAAPLPAPCGWVDS